MLRTVGVFAAALAVVVSATTGCAMNQQDDAAESTSADALSRGESAYVVYFGYENDATATLSKNDSRYSHTFASFLKTRVDPRDPSAMPSVVERHDISWLPERFTGTVCVDALHFTCPPEAGHNYNLRQTLEFARGMQDEAGNPVPYRIVMWGPYKIQPGFWDATLRQVSYLEGWNRPSYVANDFGTHLRAYRRGHGLPVLGIGGIGANNCIHAVTDITDFERTGLKWGIDGTSAAISAQRSFILGREPNAGFLVDALDIDSSDIEQR